MCSPVDENVQSGLFKITKKELERQRKITELTNLFNLASGQYGNTTKDDDMADRALRALEALILDTPFGG